MSGWNCFWNSPVDFLSCEVALRSFASTRVARSTGILQIEVPRQSSSGNTIPRGSREAWYLRHTRSAASVYVAAAAAVAAERVAAAHAVAVHAVAVAVHAVGRAAADYDGCCP